MLRRLRTFVAATLAALPLLAAAERLSDLWNDPADPGWGVSIVHQDAAGTSILFVVIFDHDAAQVPRWYTASNVRPVRLTAAGTRFEGPIHETRRPPAGPPNPGGSTVREVGSVAIIDPSTVGGATDTITIEAVIDGFAQSRTLRRQTWTAPQWGGRYEGSISSGTVSFQQLACTLVPDSPAQEFKTDFVLKLADLAGPGPIFEFSRSPTSRCRAVGPTSRQGRYLGFQGPFSCTDGESGTLTLSRVERTDTAITGSVRMDTPRCMWRGYFAGATGPGADF